MSEIRMEMENLTERRKNERIESVAKQISKFFIKSFSFSQFNFDEETNFLKFQAIIINAIKNSPFFETIPLSGSFAEWKTGFLAKNKEKITKDFMILSTSLSLGVDPQRVKEDLWVFFEGNPFPFKEEQQEKWRKLLFGAIQTNSDSLKKEEKNK